MEDRNIAINIIGLSRTERENMEYMAVYKDKNTNKTLNPKKLRDHLITWTIEEVINSDVVYSKVVYEDNASLGFIVEHHHIHDEIVNRSGRIRLIASLTKIKKEEQ